MFLREGHSEEQEEESSCSKVYLLALVILLNRHQYSSSAHTFISVQDAESEVFVIR